MQGSVLDTIPASAMLTFPCMTQRHTNLVAWQRADDLFVDIHRLAKRFPDDERFELCRQIRRAA
jgi:hypothetical protein